MTGWLAYQKPLRLEIRPVAELADRVGRSCGLIVRADSVPRGAENPEPLCGQRQRVISLRGTPVSIRLLQWPSRISFAGPALSGRYLLVASLNNTLEGE